MLNKRQILFAGGTAAMLAIGFGLWLGSPHFFAPSPAALPRIARAMVELREGRLCPKSGGAPFTGIMYEQTTTGRLLTEVPVNEGLVHGLARGWHENKQLEVEESFTNGVSHGLRTRWHENGQKRSTTTIVKGVLQGPYTEWHENGSVALKMNLVDGLGQGLSEAWFPDGKPKSKVMLDKGQPVKSEFFTAATP